MTKVYFEPMLKRILLTVRCYIFIWNEEMERVENTILLHDVAYVQRWIAPDIKKRA